MELSSKWPVCRTIVNQTTGGTSRTKLGTLPKTNIFKYCAIFCKKVAKMHLQQRSSFNSNNGQMQFCPFFRTFSLLTDGKNCVDLVAVFNKKMEETFAEPLQNRKSCVYIKYLTLFRPRRLISAGFAFLYSM